jgi:desulfoferrodoxin-like iron-binding protein
VGDLFNSLTLNFKVFILTIKGEKTMPTEANEVYECDVCGAIVEVKEGGAGTLECCGQPMTLQE